MGFYCANTFSTSSIGSLITHFRFTIDYLKIFHIFFSSITQIRNIYHVLYNHQQQRSHSGIRNMNQLLSDLTSPKKSFGYSLKTTTEFIYIIFLFHNFFPFGHPVWMPIFNIKYYSFSPSFASSTTTSGSASP